LALLELAGPEVMIATKIRDAVSGRDLRPSQCKL